MDKIDPARDNGSTSSTLYSQGVDVDEETFESDLLLMHRTLQTVVVLNPTAAILWEALQWPLSKQDLADLLTEAHPELPPESALAKVSETLGLLEENKFVTQASG